MFFKKKAKDKGKEKEQEQEQVKSLPPPYTETPEESIAVTSYTNELSNFRSRIKKIGEIHKDIPMDLIYTALNIVDSSKVDELNIPTHFRFQFVHAADYSKTFTGTYKVLRNLCKKENDFDQMLQLSRKNFINEINSHIKQQGFIENITQLNPNLGPILKNLNYDKLFKSSNDFISIDPTTINEALYHLNNGKYPMGKKSTQIEADDIIKLIEQNFIKNSQNYCFQSHAILGQDNLKVNNKINNLIKFFFKLIEAFKCDLNKVLLLTIEYSAKVHIDKSFRDIIDTVLNHYKIRYRLLCLLPSDKDIDSDRKDRTFYALLEVDDLNKIGDDLLIFSNIVIRNNTVTQN